jgi:hypothetical protein
MTINGCVRVLNNPAYPTIEATPAEVISRLRVLCSSPNHEFWEDGVSLLDQKLFRPAVIPGHHKITDLCLLGLAVRHKGKTGRGSQLPTAQFDPVPVLRSAVSI